ncbi:glucose-6-phosphate isomerase [Candidatus Fermentibacteria bacterium]|nr:glucose-6-phosphate isomerase [Candidatus Fermentibacteria bacterium]
MTNGILSRIEFETGYDFPALDDKVLRVFSEWREQGLLGFLDLPGDQGLLQQSLRAASDCRRAAGRMVVLGIGGSSLGLRATRAALGEVSRSSVVLADCPDARRFEVLKDTLDPQDTLVTVVTKSGGTAETIAGFLEMYRWLPPDLRDRRIVAVTDPEKGDLRRLAEDRGWLALPVPPSVGGRYSVMSPVGVFPAAYDGLDVEGLLQGGADVVADFDRNGPDSLPAAMAAALLQVFDTHPVLVFFAYSEYLYRTGQWFAQLWAESLGKRIDLDGKVVEVGQTPLPCRGPADQHSFGQLFMEGPPDKAFLITTVAETATPLPGGFEDYPSIAYLEDSSLHELRAAEADATTEALRERGLPVCRLDISELDARALGQLMMSLQIATVLCGLALNVNPLNQPGVERGKVLTYRALGRSGY